MRRSSSLLKPKNLPIFPTSCSIHLRPHRDDGLTDDLTAHDRVERFCGSLERKAVRNVRVELALFVPSEELGEVLSVRFGLPRGECAPEDSDDRTALQENQIRLGLRNGAARKAHDEQA